MRPGEGFGRARSQGALGWLSWLLALLILSGTVSVLHGADAMWDLKNYHLYTPFTAYHERYAFDVAPAQLQSYFNPLLDYPFYIAVKRFNDHPRAIAFCMGLPQGINLWLISILAWRLSGGRTRAVRRVLTGLAVVIGGTGAGTVPLIGTTTGDIAVAVPTLASLIALLYGVDRIGGFRTPSEGSLRAAEAGSGQAPRGLGDPPPGLLDRIARHVTPQRSLLIAGFLSGAAVGAKPTMACFTVGALAALSVAMPFRSLPEAFARFGGAVLAGLLATGGYHAVRMVRLFGSPLFPQYNNVLRSPFFDPTSLRETRFLPESVPEALFYPFGWAVDATRTFVSEVPFRDVRIALELVLIALVAAKAIHRALSGREPWRAVPRTTVALSAFVIASYVVWLALFSVYRYLLPLEMLSGVIVLAASADLVPPRAVPPLMAAAAVGCWLTTVPLEWGHTPFRDHYVEVHAPALAPDTLVLIVGDDPVSFVVPFMNPSARWLSLDNNFLHPSQNNGLVLRERRIIADHRGPMVVLAEAVDRERVSSVLSWFGLAADPAGCAEVDSSLGGQRYQLCPVRRQPS